MAIEWDSLIETDNDPDHVRFLREAYSYAWHHSDDISTKVGAVIVTPDFGHVISYGANHYSKRLCATEEERADRNYKLGNITHAEPAAVYDAAKFGGPGVNEAIMYMPWVPCEPCAKAIIGAGIEMLVGHRDMIIKTPDDWWKDIEPALARLKRCGIRFVMYDGKIGNVKALFRGNVWEP
ncbi:MAG: deaminase [Candidatus Nanoarchaeia archaeon]|jgi:deoxycytidylate deaminase